MDGKGFTEALRVLLVFIAVVAFVAGVLAGRAFGATSGGGYSVFAGIPYEVIGSSVKAEGSVSRYAGRNRVTAEFRLIANGRTVRYFSWSGRGSKSVLLGSSCRPAALYRMSVVARVYSPSGRYLRTITHTSPQVRPC